MKFVSRIGFILFLYISLVICIFAETENGKHTEIDIILDQKIPMRNGINLAAKIWKPADMEDPLPAIFVLTPYVSDEAQQRAPFFAQNGYVYVSVDCRGRGNSEGEFYPFEQDGPDGAQVVERISKQPWCDGQVAMLGGSYRGMVQCQTLRELPDTDFQVGLFEIKPDGKCVFLGNDILRARFRKSISNAELVKPGEIELYEFRRFYFFARRLKKGSRLRLVVGCINSPDFGKNYNAGGVVSEETAKDAKTAIVKLYHEKKYQSILELPVKE